MSARLKIGQGATAIATGWGCLSGRGRRLGGLSFEPADRGAFNSAMEKAVGETTFSIGEVMRFYVFSYAIAVRDAAGLLPILPRI